MAKHGFTINNSIDFLFRITIIALLTGSVLSESSPSLSSLLASSSLINFKCPEQFGYYPDKSNCSKYYVCVFGEPLHESCTGGLHFSQELQTCDWPRNVQCAAGTIRESSVKDNTNGDVQDHGLSIDDRGVNNGGTFYDYNGEIISNNGNHDKEDNGNINLNLNQNNNNNNENNNNNGDNENIRTDTEEFTIDLQRSRSINLGTIGRSISGESPLIQHPGSSRGTTIGDNPNTDSPLSLGIRDNGNDNQPPKNNRVNGDDLNNPNFEEAISSIVDESGAIHLHDGPGGIFSLVSAAGGQDPVGHGGSGVRNTYKQPVINQLRPSSGNKPNFVASRRRGSDVIPNLSLNQRSTPINHRVNSSVSVSRTVSLSPSLNRQYQNQRPLLPNYYPNFATESYKIHDDPSDYSERQGLSRSVPTPVASQRNPRQRIHIITPNRTSNYPSLEDIIEEEEDDIRRINPTTQRSVITPRRVPTRRPQTTPTTTTTTRTTTRATTRTTPRTTTTTTTPYPRYSTDRQTYYFPQSGRLANSGTRENSGQPRLEVVPLKPSGQNPSRPAPRFPTPEAFSTAQKCNERSCRLPDCYCGGTDIPGGIPVHETPQIILITFDDAINDINWHIYEEIFNTGRKNPNGCPIRGTFYVSHEWTDYGQVQTLYSRGHEIASHSITHSFGERFSKSQWHKEIAGQRDIIHLYGGVNMGDIRGMRAPFLQGGGNKMFEMLYEANFTYDSTMPVFENSPPYWPYTLDFAMSHECMIAPCPTRSFPGFWEIGMVMWQDLRGGRCSMGDACSNPTDEDGVYKMIMKNFNRHYNSNRAPFGLYYHSAWFSTDFHKRGFLRFIDEILNKKDVYFITKWQLIQWMRQPTKVSELYKLQGWQCGNYYSLPPECLNPTVCNVASASGARFFKTCQPCPLSYPWIGNNGLEKG